MATPNFAALLAKPADDVKRPVSLPEGTYFGIIQGHEFGESSKKKTPFVQFNGKFTHAHDDVDLTSEEGTPIDLTDKNFPQRGTQFYLSENAMFMVVDFIKSLGIETEGRSLGEIIPQVTGQAVQLDVIAVPVPDANNPEAPPRMVNEIRRMSGISA